METTAQGDAGGPGSDAILDWLRQYSTQKRVCDSENGTLRNILKRAKSDGVNIRALTATHKAARLDPDEVVHDLRDQVHYLSLRHIPVTRESLFDEWTPEVTEKSRSLDDIWVAEEAGYRAGRHGGGIAECPYEIGSELQQGWMRFWHQGQAAIARELGSDNKPASTAREHPMRQTRMPGTEPVQHAPETQEDTNGHAKPVRKKAARKKPARRAPARRRLTPEDRSAIN